MSNIDGMNRNTKCVKAQALGIIAVCVAFAMRHANPPGAATLLYACALICLIAEVRLLGIGRNLSSVLNILLMVVIVLTLMQRLHIFGF